MEFHIDILTWCNDAVTNADGSLHIWRTWAYVEAPSLPVNFTGTAVFRARGRDLPDRFNLLLQLQTLDKKPLSDVLTLEVQSGPVVGGWQIVAGYAQVNAVLPQSEQIFVLETEDGEFSAELPLPVVVKG